MGYKQEASEIISACLKMQDMGLNQGTAGNLSMRVENGILITPSGMPYHSMGTEDIIFIDRSGKWEEGLIPSSEWRFHLSTINDHPEFNVVVHNHAPYATMVACSGDDCIPAIHYMIAMGGGNRIPCVPYATYGTEELSRHISKGMKGFKACILKNHGLLVAEKTFEKALNLAQEVEFLARIYIQLKASGGYTVLPDEEIEVVLERFKNYGLNVNHRKR